MNEAQLVEQFEKVTLEPAMFSHENHVKLTWTYLKQYPIPEVMIKLRNGLKAFTEHLGLPEKYHETITFAYVVLIAGVQAARPETPWLDFKKEYPEFFGPWPQLLARYYSPGVLETDRARQIFIMPDLNMNQSAA